VVAELREVVAHANPEVPADVAANADQPAAARAPMLRVEPAALSRGVPVLAGLATHPDRGEAGGGDRPLARQPAQPDRTLAPHQLAGQLPVVVRVPHALHREDV